MGFDVKLVVVEDETNIPESILCPCCNGLFENPVQCCNGHSVCFGCIKEDVAECITCGAFQRRKHLTPNRALVDLVERFRIRCEIKPCVWEGVPSAMRDHGALCPYRVEVCGIDGCDATFLARDIEGHDITFADAHARLAVDLSSNLGKRRIIIKSTMQDNKKMRDALCFSSDIRMSGQQLAAMTSANKFPDCFVQTVLCFNSLFHIVKPSDPLVRPFSISVHAIIIPPRLSLHGSLEIELTDGNITIVDIPTFSRTTMICKIDLDAPPSDTTPRLILRPLL